MAINDVATLGIQVTTSGADTAKRSLDDLAASGDRAAASTTKLGQASADAAKKYASPQYRQQADDLAKLAGQIDPTIAALARLDAQQAKLVTFKKAGMLGADDFNALNSAIEANRSKFTAAGNAMSHFSLNTSLARREVGRLAADVANGNWGRFEQTSLTLANYSGLLGAAFSGTGAMLLGLVAAVGLGIVAYQHAQDETAAYNKALITTGDIAGVTAGKLANMAKSVSDASRTSTASSAEAIASVAATGRFTGEQIQTIATAAQEMAASTGQSLKETIKQFVSLGNDPANAIVKLNDEQHFLTLSVYDQIRALQDQGQEQEAVDLAMRTYATTIATRSPEIEKHLGGIKKWWDEIGKASSDALERISVLANGGPTREQVLKENRGIAQQHVASGDGASYFLDGSYQQYLQRTQAEWDKITAAQASQQKAAQQKADVQNANDLSIHLAREADVYASSEVKRARLIAKAHGDANDAIAKAEKVQDANLRLQLITQAKANEEAVIAGIESRAKKPPRPKADPFTSLNNLRDKAYNQFDQASAVDSGSASTAQAKLYEQEVQQLQAIAKAGAQAIEKGGSLAKAQAEVADATSKVTAAFALESQQLSAKNAAALKAYQDAIDNQIAAKQRQIDLQVQSVGMGAKEVQQMQAIDAIYAKVASTIEQLERQRAQKGANTQLIDGQIAAQKASLPILVKQQQDAYKQMDAAQASWSIGAIRAMENVRDEGLNVAGLTANAFTSAFNSMGDALAAFVTTGKINFKGLVSSILTDIARMEVRILESKVANSILGAFLGGGSSMATSFDSNGTFFSPYANGGVFQNSPSLSAYSGSVVSSPTPFLFASGAGIMGEAGPEAIMPLRRGPDGKLGVAAGGSGGAPGVTINVNVDNSGAATQKTTGDTSAYAHQFAQAINAKVREGIANEQRPGGLLWRMQNA